MKRFLSALVALTLLATLLSSCAGGLVSSDDAESLTAEELQKKREQEDREDAEMARRDFEENKTMTFEGKTYELTFMDSFNGHRLDWAQWEHCPNWTRDQCVWTDDEAYLKDGNLILNVAGDGVPYASGAIRTRDRFEQAFGYFEVRCRLPQVDSGICSAFWLMCRNMSDDPPGAEDGAEIDIFEAVPGFSPAYVQHAIHWDGYSDSHQSWESGFSAPQLYEGYHTYALLWDEDGYRFYIDGQLSKQHDGDVCQVPCYLKLTASVGGWTGELDPGVLPVHGLEVDYVKVYQVVEE